MSAVTGFIASAALAFTPIEVPLTIAEQISAIGNSVCPPMARALVLANQPSRSPQRMAA